MKKQKKDRIGRAFRIGSVVILLFCLGLLGKAITDRAQAKPDEPSEEASVYIVYTDEQSHPYAVQTTWACTEYWEHAEKAEPEIILLPRDRLIAAAIVTGQAGDQSLTCQTMIANVLYNQMLANEGQIDGTAYSKCVWKKPTKEAFEAVDAIFKRGEWLLDQDVLVTGDVNDPDEWYKSMVYVCECGGIAFYRYR